MINRMYVRLLLPVVLTSLAACASVEPMSSAERNAVPMDTALGAEFCYPPVHVDAALTLIKEKKRFSVYAGSFMGELPGDEDEDPITFELYRPAGVDKAPVAIVLPILNGQKHIVRPFAQHFTKNGFASVIVDSRQRTTLETDIVDPQAAIREAVQRHRRMLDWIEQQPDLDAERIVVFGASLGGFNAFFLAATDNRVKAVAPALVGADLPFIFAHSNEGRIEAAFERVMRELELDRDGLEDYMRERIATDTATMTPHVNRDRVLMIVAKRDKAVPFEKQVELRELMGEPETVFLPTGHLSSAMYIFYLRGKVLHFFERMLEEPDRGTAAISRGSCLNSQTPRIMQGVVQ